VHLRANQFPVLEPRRTAPRFSTGGRADQGVGRGNGRGTSSLESQRRVSSGLGPRRATTSVHGNRRENPPVGCVPWSPRSGEGAPRSRPNSAVAPGRGTEGPGTRPEKDEALHGSGVGHPAGAGHAGGAGPGISWCEASARGSGGYAAGPGGAAGKSRARGGGRGCLPSCRPLTRRNTERGTASQPPHTAEPGRQPACRTPFTPGRAANEGGPPP